MPSPSSNLRAPVAPTAPESHLSAELSAARVATNLALVRDSLEPGTELCVVVKADAYGHGIRQMLPLLAAADRLAVTSAGEAVEVRELGWQGPLLMFFTPFALAVGAEADEAIAEMVARGVVQTVSSWTEAEAIAAAARRLGERAEVHLKIDTGMARSGAQHRVAAELLMRLREQPELDVTGAYTHFATADESDSEYVHRQLERLLAVIEAAGGRAGLCLHAANTAATLCYPETHLDLVRTGLAIYGSYPSPELERTLDLEPVLRLKTRVMQLRSVAAGSRCGYGLEHTFERDSVLGLVPIGYADGYLRRLGGTAVMGLRGKEVPVCGRVAMDQVIVDVTDVPAAAVGDEIEVISAESGAPNSVEGLAALAGTIPYEITCRLGLRVPRRVVDAFS